ncbi:hypothetical protein ABMA28_009099 [Loxostege sticticalis]|uniref:XK-related protein n=1 Tax=Loxostege sticticalis TaxID=481309 RepID=A0ABD0SCT3_LOXSC
MPKALRDLLQSEISYDEPDRMPAKITITNLDIILYCFAIVGHFVDLGLDLNVAVRYAVANQMVEFGWTLAFILLPAFVNTAVSIRIYAIKSRRAERKQDPATARLYYALMLKEDSDAALLRVFECFLEAAPQLVLQVSLLLRGDQQLTVHQSLSITSSLVSMSWCLASYQRAVRFAQEDKLNMNWVGSALQAVYHYLLSVSRVISISLIAYHFPYWTVLACSIHILIMTAWIQIFEHPVFCSQNKFAELAFSLALGAVYLFTYILAVEGRTRYRYATYYTVCFCQNVACGLLWYFFVEDQVRESPYFLLLLLLTVIPYVAGLVIMVVYYMFFHPKLRRGVRDVNITVSYKSEQADDVK